MLTCRCTKFLHFATISYPRSLLKQYFTQRWKPNLDSLSDIWTISCFHLFSITISTPEFIRTARLRAGRTSPCFSLPSNSFLQSGKNENSHHSHLYFLFLASKVAATPITTTGGIGGTCGWPDKTPTSPLYNRTKAGDKKFLL